MKTLSFIKRKIQFLKDAKTTARFPRHSDFYVVDFPKSGVTWLSTILANISLIESNRKEIASFSQAHLFVPDIHVSRDVSDVAYDRPPVRFIKSHAMFNRNYIFVIYLVRHPLNVMKSYYNFSREIQGDTFGNFHEFCLNPKFGISAWKFHVNSWLRGETINQRLHLIRYEDMVSNTYDELERLSVNFGWNFSSENIEKAISFSSIQKMTESERLYKLKNPRYNITFVKNNVDLEITDETLEFIRSSCVKELGMLDYEV
ncbi:MAG: hypothetical protein ACI909_002851 [Planctomycetota bacterium]|jgi:hypothetical protein